MSKINKFIVGVIIILALSISVAFYNALKHHEMQKVTYDLPEEFNPQTVSHDRSDATVMMVVYDTLTNTYIFEFIDK